MMGGDGVIGLGMVRMGMIGGTCRCLATMMDGLGWVWMGESVKEWVKG